MSKGPHLIHEERHVGAGVCGSALCPSSPPDEPEAEPPLAAAEEPAPAVLTPLLLPPPPQPPQPQAVGAADVPPAAATPLLQPIIILASEQGSTAGAGQPAQLVYSEQPQVPDPFVADPNDPILYDSGDGAQRIAHLCHRRRCLSLQATNRA